MPLDDSKLFEAVLTALAEPWEIIPFVAGALLGSLVLAAAFIEIRQRFF